MPGVGGVMPDNVSSLYWLEHACGGPLAGTIERVSKLISVILKPYTANRQDISVASRC